MVEGQDEKTAEKFRKLMGIKPSSGHDNLTSLNSTMQIQQMQHKAFETMDKEYQMARMTTHTHRGQGLGFASSGVIDPNIPQRSGTL